MARIGGGRYVPLYKGAFANDAKQVDAFHLAVHPVTNGDFLAFVRANPTWRRSQVKRLFAEDNYLRHWSGDLEPGPKAPADHPVVNVSWFAARAFAEWKGMRLPTVAEWEYAASAGSARPDGRNEDGFFEDILRRYTARSATGPRPVTSSNANYWGVYDLHGLVWEWVDDFNSNVVTGESRNDTDLDRGLFCGSASLGATDFKDYSAFIRFALRSSLKADYTVSHVGFRLAADASDRL